MSYRKLCEALVAMLTITTPVLADDLPTPTGTNKVVSENWRPCSTGYQRADGEISWLEIPTWARSPKLRPYYDNDPRLLANHGLCNAKFHRVVLCLPAWDTEEDAMAARATDWYRICYEHAKQSGNRG